jgi:hypothetical protein
MDEQATGSTAPSPSAAQFAEACLILESSPPPEQVRHAVDLLGAASDGGSAEASEVLALFEAMGVVAPKDWNRSFDLLERAAAQGSRTAMTQLLLLAKPAEAPEVSGGEDWGGLRDSISIDRLLATGQRIALCERPRIRILEGFATVHECAWLIERARPRLQRAKVIRETGEHGIDDYRSNSGASFQVMKMDVVLEVLRNRIAAATRVPLPLFEPTQVLHYGPGEQFAPHFDFVDPANPAHHAELSELGQRMATFLIYLNEAFEGGETEFPRAGIRYRGRTGDAIFWANVDDNGQPEQLSYHAGRPPLSGEKWILSQWLRDRVRTPAPA